MFFLTPRRHRPHPIHRRFRWPTSAMSTLTIQWIAPVFHPDVLEKFPPTLLITGTRSLDVSSVAYMHTQMANLDVESCFYSWEGMWYAFMNGVDIPEAQEAFDVIVKFFDEQLGK
jgi:monoterpene epsilon-lactone hydrolase